jgi:ATP-dependent Clp protease ATP-binding subunit ClpX
MLKIDTSDILFICGGTFEGLLQVIADRVGVKRRIGLPNLVSDASKVYRTDNLLRHVSHDDLLKYGLIPELAGRLPVRVTLDSLDHRALIDVLTRPKNAVVKQYQRMLSLDGVELAFTEDALRAAADEAIKRGSGARGLRAIIERTLMDVMYEAPSRRDIRKVVVDAAAILDQASPKLYDQTGRQIGSELDKAA